MLIMCYFTRQAQKNTIYRGFTMFLYKWKLGETFYSAGKTSKGNEQGKQTPDAVKTIKKQWAH